jgi:hypothetical protein
MKDFYLLSILFLCIYQSLNIQNCIAQQNISGQINSYAQVTSISGNNLSVSNTTGFTVGGKVLIIQMQDASVSTTNNSSFGSLTAINAAGLFEILSVSSISSGVITVSGTISNTYNSSASVQLVSIPEYPGLGAVITSNLSPQSWNGTSGGIVILMASVLDMQASINVSGEGFRGGTITGNMLTSDPIPSPPYGLAWSAGFGEKGEGITLDPASSNLTTGSGPGLNGGGSGGYHGYSGGGGSNVGIGGNGGNGPASALNGMGGYALPYPSSPMRVFMGGGGGAGSQDVLLNANGGGKGGGLVFLIVDTIIPHNTSILAYGTSANTGADAGGGGGSAGGAIFLSPYQNSSIYIDPNAGLSLKVNGSDGSAQSSYSSDCYGVGGGGGGGVIYYPDTIIQANVKPYLCGGNPGQIPSNPNCSGYGSSNGASPGDCGTIYNSTTGIRVKTVPCSAYALQDSLCNLDTLFLFAGISSQAAHSVQWTGPNGFTSTQLNPSFVFTSAAAGIYTLVVYQCCPTDTCFVEVTELLKPDRVQLTGDNTICVGQTSDLYFSSGTNTLPYSLTYTDGTTVYTLTGITGSPLRITLTPSATVTYTLTSAWNSCDSITYNQSVVVLVNPLPIANAGTDTLNCGLASYSFTLGGAMSTAAHCQYNWNGLYSGFNFSEFHPDTFITLTQSEIFYLTVTDTLTRCRNYDTLRIDISCVPVDLRVFLQGGTYDFNNPTFLYFPAPISPPIMRSDLYSNLLLPNSTPYTGYPGNPAPAPANYTGLLGNINFNIPNVVDWVLVELREVIDPNHVNHPDSARQDSVVANFSGILLEDGQIVDHDGQTFPFIMSFNQNNPVVNRTGPFYIVIKHRNHLPVISSVPVSVNGMGVLEYDFTTGINQAWQNPNLPANNYPQLGFYRTNTDGPPYTSTYSFATSPFNVACMIGGNSNADDTVRYDPGAVNISDDWHNINYLGNNTIASPYPASWGDDFILQFIYDDMDVAMNGFVESLKYPCIFPCPWFIKYYYDIEFLQYCTSDRSVSPIVYTTYISNVPK